MSGAPPPSSTGNTLDDREPSGTDCRSLARTTNTSTPHHRRPRRRIVTAPVTDVGALPFFLTADEAAALLRTTRKAIYARAERGLLPGAVHDGRRILVRRDELLRSLSEGRATSPGGRRR